MEQKLTNCHEKKLIVATLPSLQNKKFSFDITQIFEAILNLPFNYLQIFKAHCMVNSSKIDSTIPFNAM